MRGQGGASLNIPNKRQVEYFTVKKFNFAEFCTLVFQFDNFPSMFDDNDERMQSDSSGRRRNDEKFASSRFV